MAHRTDTVSGSVYLDPHRSGLLERPDFKGKGLYEETDYKVSSSARSMLASSAVHREPVREQRTIGRPAVRPHPITSLILRNNPVGLGNTGNNCWLNTLLQTVVLTTPQLMDWIMDVELPLTDEDFATDVRAYREVFEAPIPGGLETEARKELIRIKDEARQNYIRMHLKQFLFSYYEHQVLGGTPVPQEETQALRVALSCLSDQISPSAAVQEDSTEGLTTLMNLLPEDSPLYTAMVTTLTLDARAHPLPVGHSGTSVVRKNEWGNVPLPIGRERNFTRLISSFLTHRNPEHEGLDLRGRDGSDHRYIPIHEKRQFDSPPPFLFVQLKRFEWRVRNVERTVGGFFGFGGRKEVVQEHYRVKIRDPISVSRGIHFTPTFIGGTPAGNLARYRINSICVHSGATLSSGHYWSLIRRGTDWWYVSDRTSRKATEQEIETAFNEGYNYQFQFMGSIPDPA